MISCWDTLRKKIKNSCSHGLIVLKKIERTMIV